MQPLRHYWLPYDVIMMGAQFKITTFYLLFLSLVEFYLRERIIIINDVSVEIKRHQSQINLFLLSTKI